MKTLATAITAVLATCAVASATDLPSRTKAPAIAGKAPVATSANSTISFGYGPEYSPDALLSDKASDGYGLSYTHRFGQYHFGAALGITNDVGSSTSKTDLEGRVGFTQPIYDGWSTNATVGVGQRFQSSGDLPYFAIYGGADYRLSDTITINAIGYRYRDSFDSGRDFNSNQLSTGITVAVTDNTSITAKVYRQYDGAWNGTSDGIGIGASVSF